MSDFEELYQQTKKMFPSFQILNKSDSVLCKLIDYVLKLLSGGKNSTFMTQFITTIGNLMFVPSSWDSFTDESKYLILYHERTHMIQQQRIGSLKFAFLYLLAWFPIFFAKYRRDFEIEAYANEYVAGYEKYQIPITPQLRHVVDNLTNSNYLWTWHNADEVLEALRVQIFSLLLKSSIKDSAQKFLRKEI